MKRIQRRRTAGWKMPAKARYIGRPSKWGNPYAIRSYQATPGDRRWRVYDRRNGKTQGQAYRSRRLAHRLAAILFLQYAYEQLERDPAWLEPLRGHDLACWCSLDQPCHGDILIELIARIKPTKTPKEGQR